MSEYCSFALYYDELMRDADYKGYADYIESLFKKLGHCPGIILDVACGTGSLTLELHQRGYDIYGADMSVEMLSAAREKAALAGADILFLCQKMQELDLYGTVNTVICSFDGINHLLSEEEIEKAFSRISFFIEPNGYFIFDVNTVYKHEKILADNIFVYDTENVYCVWQNTPAPDSVTEISLDFFEKRGELYKRSAELFSERAYPETTLRELLNKAGFDEIYCFDGMSFNAPKIDSQRIVFAARKQA